jgi:hypothetical protein
MYKVRILFNSIIIVSTSIIVGILAYDNLNVSDNKELIEMSLQIMHTSFFIGAILNIIFFLKNRKYLFVFLTVFPMLLFVFAFIGIAYEFRFSNISLIFFDFYLIFWFYFLTIKEFFNNNLIKKKQSR